MRRRRTGATAFEGDHRRAFPRVNPVSWAWPDLNSGLILIRYRGLSAVQTAVSPGHR
jgi:hypothetical protein